MVWFMAKMYSLGSMVLNSLVDQKKRALVNFPHYCYSTFLFEIKLLMLILSMNF